MARSLKKGPYVFERLLKKVQELNKNNKIHQILSFIESIRILINHTIKFVMRKAKDGKWYLWDQFLLVGIRPPKSADPWA